MHKYLSPAHILTALALMMIGFKSISAEPQFVEGVDYQTINISISDNVDQLTELEDFNHIELFYWYGCQSCYQVDAALLGYQQNNPHLSIRRIPLVLRTDWREQAYIQAILEQVAEAKTDEILEIYRQCLTDCSVFSSFENSKSWILQRYPNTEASSIDNSLVWQTQKNYQKRADFLSIRQVPTIIIKDTYKVDASQAKTAKRLLEIIDFLLAK
jgi:hypothetical protein